MHGNLPVVRYLVEQAKADVNSRTWKGGQPIHWAVRGGSLRVVQLLIKNYNVSKDTKRTQDGK